MQLRVFRVQAFLLMSTSWLPLLFIPTNASPLYVMILSQWKLLMLTNSQIRSFLLFPHILSQPTLRLLLRAPLDPLHLLMLLVRSLLFRHPQQLV